MRFADYQPMGDGTNRVYALAREAVLESNGRSGSGDERRRPMTSTIEYVWRGDISDAELVELTDSYGGNSEAGWWDRIRPFSLGWVSGRLVTGDAVAFVNVAWDGGDHAFLIDTKVRSDLQRQGIGTELVRIATDHARRTGCEWLHVDYDDRERLEPFYVGACGFRPISAAVIRLHDLASN